jgi:indolepyruvate decarboxylase
MGCRDWFCTKVETVAEFESALEAARNHSGASYLELMIPPEESQPLSKKTINHIYKTYAA